MGIYITNAVKTPKTEYAIARSTIEDSLPYLEKELALFPNKKVIMLMGDVAKKAFNMITKKSPRKMQFLPFPHISCAAVKYIITASASCRLIL